MSKVGVVIVSHSSAIAKGAADMVWQMVGDAVPLAYCGGNPAGGLGTDVVAIKNCLEQTWNPAGVVVLIDLGGAEMNTEMAIELLEESKRTNIVICNAAVVEGAVMAATESSLGGTLQEVKEAAEEAI
jgi:phosphoenolpyruvate---glycerone phosphotransferase subunit DhaM